MIRPTLALPMGVSFVVVERPSGLVSIKPKPTSPQRFTLPKSANNLEAHGGRLWAIPCEPQGALFQFTIPDA
jgi:hypothetical protein